MKTILPIFFGLPGLTLNGSSAGMKILEASNKAFTNARAGFPGAGLSVK